jgi:hypothetical protein
MIDFRFSCIFISLFGAAGAHVSRTAHCDFMTSIDGLETIAGFCAFTSLTWQFVPYREIDCSRLRPKMARLEFSAFDQVTS